MSEVVGVPAGAKVIEVMPLGYPADKPRAKDRKALDEIVCYDKYE